MVLLRTPFRRGHDSCPSGRSKSNITRIATANRPSDRGGKPSISNIGLQLRESSLIVDQLAASIITLLAQSFGISRKRKGFDWKTFAGLGRKSYGNQ